LLPELLMYVLPSVYPYVFSSLSFPSLHPANALNQGNKKRTRLVKVIFLNHFTKALSSDIFSPIKRKSFLSFPNVVQ